jgi:hypothetical protein
MIPSKILVRARGESSIGGGVDHPNPFSRTVTGLSTGTHPRQYSFYPAACPGAFIHFSGTHFAAVVTFTRARI